MVMRTYTRMLVMLLAVFCLSFAVAAPLAGAQEKTSIKVGMTVSTTGPFAYAAEQGFKGVQIWVDHVNSRGGLYVESLGKQLPVELIYYDDRSDKTMVARLYERLITEDQIDIAIAPFGSTLTSAAAPVTEKYNIPLIMWSAAADSLYEQGFQYIISGSQLVTAEYAVTHAPHMVSLGVQSVAILYLDQPFPAGQAESMRRYSESLGAKVVAFESFPEETRDFTTLLHRIRLLNPDGLYVAAYIDEQANILRQLKEMDLTFPYIHFFYSAQPVWFDMTGDDGLYVFGASVYDPSIRWDVTAGLYVEEFIDYFWRLFPDAELPPDFQTALAYSSGVMLEEFVRHAGSLDAAAIKQAALDLSGKVTVLTGDFNIDETGRQLGMQWAITQVRKDDEGNFYLTVVWPPEVATDESVYPIPPWRNR